MTTATARGSRKGRLVLVCLVVLLLIGGFAAYFGWVFVGGVKAGVRGAVEAMYLTPASESWAANRIAVTHHIPDGDVTLQMLDSGASTSVMSGQRSRWVGADAAVPETANLNLFSVSVGADHVLVASSIGVCVFGLEVSADSDPIIARDQLPGTGTFTATQSDPTDNCSADSAPNTGWARVSPADMRLITSSQ